MKDRIFKKIEDLDHYEILNLPRDAAFEEVTAAYREARSSYLPDSLASYGLFSEEERRVMLEKIENAYRTLMDPRTRREYDETSLPAGSSAPLRAVFRRSTQRLEIQDAEEPVGFLGRIRNMFRANRPAAQDDGDDDYDAFAPRTRQPETHSRIRTEAPRTDVDPWILVHTGLQSPSSAVPRT